MWLTKKIKIKNKSQVSTTWASVASWMGEGGYFGFFYFFHKGVNQTENFTRVKTGNDIYYWGEKHY